MILDFPIAKRPTNPDADEIAGQLIWFADLRDIIASGDNDLAIETIDAAVKLLRRKDYDDKGNSKSYLRC